MNRVVSICFVLLIGSLCLSCSELPPTSHTYASAKKYQRVLVRCLQRADKKKANLLEAQVVESLKSKGRVFAMSQHEAFSTKRSVSILEALRFASNQRIAAVLTVTPTSGDAYDLKLTDVKTNGNTWFGEVTLSQNAGQTKDAASLIASKLISTHAVAPTAEPVPLLRRSNAYRRN
jgi:hypothetical protein